MITEETPSDWRALQQEVANILIECGFDVQIEKRLEMVRGAAEIDVYAEETVRGRKSIILIECKNWKTRVPQSVVHAFRTVVADTGANVGYIVGSSGFQSGALEAARMANIRLVTWYEFQVEFVHQWLDAHVVPALWPRVDAFLRWTEPLPPSPGRELTPSEKEAFMTIWEQLQPLVVLFQPFMSYMHSLGDYPAYPQLPLSASARWRDMGLPPDILKASGYRELIARAVVHADAGLHALRAAAHVESP